MSFAPPPDPRRTIEPPRPLRTTLAAVVGNLFEWYDFVVFGFFAPVISEQFFGDGQGTLGVLKAFGVFAVGYFARPLGAVIFGMVGDRLGRKPALLLSLVVMAVPTLGMMLIPTWQTVGILSPILLVLFRVLQGISVGGEFSGAVAYLSEHAAEHRRGLTGALTVSSAMLGILLGSLVFGLMTLELSPAALQAWGWRAAFGLGLVILIVAGGLRLTMPVSPQFARARAAGKLVQHPIRDCLVHHRASLWRALVLISAPALLCYAVTVYMSEFLHSQGQLPRAQASLMVTVGIGLSVGIPLIAGALSDRIGRRPLIRASFLASALWSLPLFLLAGSGHELLAWCAVLIAAVILGTMQGIYPAALSELFPTAVRFTGSAVAYNVSFAIFGGTFPLLATWLVNTTKQSTAPGWYLGSLTVVCLILIWRIPETARCELDEITPL